MGTTIAENNRRWRRANPEAARVLAQRKNARDSAARRLATLHPDEFDRFYAEECERRGVTPYAVAAVSPGRRDGVAVPSAATPPSSP